jgi:hypothetical protein
MYVLLGIGRNLGVKTMLKSFTVVHVMAGLHMTNSMIGTDVPVVTDK